MTDFRALCAELLEAIEQHVAPLEEAEVFETLLDRARAALAEGAGVGAFPAEPVKAADAAELIATETGLEWNSDAGMYLCSVHDLEAIARAVLARYGTHPRPIPVAERMPTDEDLNELWNCCGTADESGHHEGNIFEYARIAISRYGHRPQPISIADMQPIEADRDGDGECWWWDEVTYAWVLEVGGADYSWWLPAAAIPLPEGEK